MKNLLAALAVLTASSLLAATASDDVNPVKNPSFEIGEDEFDYDGWKNSDATGWAFSITNVAAHGKRALFAEKDCGVLCQDVTLTPGTYELTLKAMAFPGTTKGTQPPAGLGVTTELRYTPKKGEKGVVLYDSAVTGCAKDAQPKWETLRTGPLIVPEGIDGKAFVRIRVGLFYSKTGQGLIDDIVVRKLVVSD